ncbi:hypothetical protein [Streptomyces albidoflavus]|uniref:hypothetical protein n=1 Tax=Streptomyces albidoflavus TaxID=1886 RepID=UPI002F919CD9|nr:hypothetical protein OG919_24130 [Streptomyces albidoflavus]WTC46050.1 hypothetical protein OH810_31245 [Streptomyces albidoflavus]WTD45912.1 hypothetical protein OH730_30770 [Streptomyces albidoflavus]WTD86198.1 hypothetical protein OHA92_31230 [Streptomyces albidoflavus]
MTSPETAGWQPLSRRDISTREEALFEGVPNHLVRPLKAWIAEYLDGHPKLTGRVALRMKVVLDTPDPEQLVEAVAVGDPSLLLDVVDVVLHLDRGLWWELDVAGPEPLMEAGAADWIPDFGWPKGSKGAAVESLDDMLMDAGSAFEVDWRHKRLQRRVDGSVTAAAEQAMGMDAGRHLQTAWSAVYGRQPDPSKAYDEAIRAVEAAAIPVMLPKGKTETLGKVLTHLTDADRKWELAIAGPSDGSVAPLIEMIRLLWKGHVARHAGGPNFRPQRQDEAQMAVHLAATLVHWFTTGAVRPRTSG